jgi:ATP-dependent Clp protease ATP-binding subunit ClpA
MTIQDKMTVLKKVILIIQPTNLIKSKTPVLDNFGRDLTEMAEEGKLDPVVGREKEIERVCQILSRRKEQPSPMVNLELENPLLRRFSFESYKRKCQESV